jgi:parvulin-like peptidyl-prolyl isomerase
MGVVGPVESRFGFHVFEVIDFFSAGSFVGLDEVYDEVSQEIYRNKRLVLFDNLLDSLTLEYKALEIKEEEW